MHGSSEILEMVALGAENESNIEALAFLIEKIAPETRCAIMAIDSEIAEEQFCNACASSVFGRKSSGHNKVYEVIS